MHSELQVAVQFVCSYLYNKLPRRRIDGFGFELQKALDQKFEGHWYPERPTKGSAYRCLKFQSSRLDPAVDIASKKSGLKVEEILANLPHELMVWIDPREVSYRIGEKGFTKILYSDHHAEEGIDNMAADNEVASHAGFVDDASRFAFNPDAATFKPIDSLATSMNNLSLGLSPVSSALSPVSPTSSFGTSPSPTTMLHSRPNTSPTSEYARTPQKSQHMFTAAMFAQTKFGSTKLKNSGKRTNFPPRQSPTEVGAYFKQRNGLNNGSAYQRVPNNFSSQRDWLPTMPRHDSAYNCWADPFFPRVEEIPSYGFDTRPIATSVKPNRMFYDAMNFQGSINGRYGQHPLVAAN